MLLFLEEKKADVTNLQIIKKDDHLQFDKVSKIDERSMIQIQEGIGEYNLGAKALAKKEYKAAQKNLKNAEKRLKRGKISEDGLNFSRGNLAISYLALQDKRGLGQAKRYLKAITSKIYSNQKWTYNLAVAYADFSARSARTNKDGSVKHTTASSLNLKEAIKRNDVRSLDRLIRKGVDIHAKDSDGKTLKEKVDEIKNNNTIGFIERKYGGK